MNFRLEPWHINRGQVELALIHPQDSDSLPPAQMPIVKLSIAHVAAGLKGHCPLVALQATMKEQDLRMLKLSSALESFNLKG